MKETNSQSKQLEAISSYSRINQDDSKKQKLNSFN